MNRLAIIEHQRLTLLMNVAHFASWGTEYALLDFPNYSNVGDSAIWLGAIKLLRETSGNPPAYVSTIGDDFDPAELTKALPSGPIFLLGGGNFGDIWPAHQEFRLRLAELFPDRRIVQLPQSISFTTEKAIAETRHVLSTHRDFHLFVRDRASLDFARDRLGIEAILTPDCAAGLGPLQTSDPVRDVLCLMRTDKEATGIDYSLLKSLPDSLYCDWIGDNKALLPKVQRRLMSTLEGGLDPMKRRKSHFNRAARARFNRGMALIGSARHVVTDRLHVHILSTLAGVPNVALDNNYGKISGYLQQWNAGIGIVSSATSAEEAVARLDNRPLEAPNLEMAG